MPSKIQGVLCANNAEAIQRLNTTVEQLSEQLHEVHLNPLFTELIRQLQELRAKLASRDAEVERLVERMSSLERKVAGLEGRPENPPVISRYPGIDPIPGETTGWMTREAIRRQR